MGSRDVKKVRTRGFTLFELLLTISLLAALTGGVAFITNGFKSENDLRLASTIVEHGIRSAKLYAYSGRFDDPWGTKILPEEVVVFRGTTYDGRIVGADEAIPLPSYTDISGIDEIVFARASTSPNTTGTITLTNSAGGTNITINELGVIVP